MVQEFEKGTKIEVLKEKKFREQLEDFITNSWSNTPDTFIITGFKDAVDNPYYSVINYHTDGTDQSTISKDVLIQFIEDDILQDTGEVVSTF